MTVHAETQRSETDPRILQYYRDLDALQMTTAATNLSPQAIAGIAATQEQWAKIRDTYGLLTAHEASIAAGARGKHSTLAVDRRRQHRLMATRRGNALMFPGFQFKHGHVLPAVERVAQAAAELEVPEDDALLWFLGPTTQFADQAAPVQHLEDPSAVEEAFINHFGVEW